MAGPHHRQLITKEFTALSVVFFLASAVMALFFQFQHYLQSLPISPRWFGFLIGADALASFVLQPILAVRLRGDNSRAWLVIALAGMALSLFAYNFALSLASVAAVRIVHGAAFVLLVSAMMAILTSIIPAEKSGRAFGFISIIRLLPYSLVPPLVGMAGDRPADFRHFLTIGGLAMLLTTVVALRVRVKPSESPGSRHETRRPGGKDLLVILGERKVAAILAVQTLLYSSYTIVFFFLKEYGRGHNIENPGFFFTIASATMIGARILGAPLFDRMNKALLTGISMVGLGACYCALGLTGSREVFYLCAFLCGLGWGIAMPVALALAFDVSEARLRSMNVNLSMLMMQVGFFVGPSAGGLLLSWGGYGLLFTFTASLSIFAACLVWAAFRRRPS